MKTSEHSNQSKSDTIAKSALGHDESRQAPFDLDNIVISGSDSNIQGHAGLLNNTNLTMIQRQKIASNIGLTFGNQYLQRVISLSKLNRVSGGIEETSLDQRTIQEKYKVNYTDDQYEREANQTADSVMRMPLDVSETLGPDNFSPSPDSCNLNLHHIQKQAQEKAEVTKGTEEHIRRMQGGGHPLPSSERNFFEKHMGADFRAVRVHTDENAIQSSRNLNARAFTIGKDIAFGAEAYQPGTDVGRRLIAHELTHVIQQTGRGKTCKETSVVNCFNKEDIELRRDTSIITPLSAPSIARKIIQRTFDPNVTRSVDALLTLLNDPDSSVRVNVTNYRSAPQDTVYNWHWQSVDDEKVEDLGASPPNRPNARLKLKPKRLFSDLSMLPELETTNSEGSTTKQTNPVSVGTMDPGIDWSIESISRGGRGAGQASGGITGGEGGAYGSIATIFVGDTIKILARFDNVVSAQTADIDFRTLGIAVAIPGGSGAGRFEKGNTNWISENQAEIPITGTAAGNTSITVYASIPGREEDLSHELDLSIINDPRGFKDKCSTANSLITSRFSAGREYFLTSSINYKTGYDAHKAVLDAENARRKLANDIILGVLFGAIGGAAGGAVGGALGGWFKNNGQVIATALGAAGTGAVTDTAKDLTKYIARLPPRLLSEVGGGGGSETGAGPATAGPGGATGRAGVTGAGASSPAASDPFGWFLTVERALELEKREAADLVLTAQRVADRVLERGENVTFDWDPEMVVRDNCTIDEKPLDELGEPPTAQQYEKAFWLAWLSQYAYQLHTDIGGTTVRSAVTGKLREALERVARAQRENLDDWIDLVGGPLREDLERHESGPGIITWD